LDGLFDLKIGYLTPPNPVALASMAGITGSEFAQRFAESAGLLVIGGYNMDAETNKAAQRMEERGRKEFVSDNPPELLENELTALDGVKSSILVSVRAASVKGYLEAALIAKKHGAGIEIDAHCRQPEMTELGVGEALLHDPSRLRKLVWSVKRTGVVVSVKTRANIVDDTELAKSLEEAGADIIHVDAMRPGAGHDPGVIRRVRNATGLFIIGNNSVTDLESAKDLFGRGADMVSLARAVLKNPDTIQRLARELADIQELTGWYNAPKHICAGGDLRALAFCCPPVKNCPVHRALKEAGLTPQEFTRLKLELTRGTPLQPGEVTCFGTMAWCCKITKPCPLRDTTLARHGLPDTQYSQLKKQLSQQILNYARSKKAVIKR